MTLIFDNLMSLTIVLANGVGPGCVHQGELSQLWWTALGLGKTLRRLRGLEVTAQRLSYLPGRR